MNLLDRHPMANHRFARSVDGNSQTILVLALSIATLLLLAIVIGLLAGGSSKEEPPRQPPDAGEQLTTKQPNPRGTNGGVINNPLPETKDNIAVTPQDLEAQRRKHQAQLESQQQAIQTESATLDLVIGDLPRFAEKLSNLAKKYPKSHTASSFRQVSIEAPLWEAVFDWSRLMQDLNRKSMKNLSFQRARELVGEADRLTENAAIEPYCTLFDASREHIRKVASRVDFDDKQIDATLDTFLDRPLIGHLFVLMDIGGIQYYLRGKEAVQRRPDRARADTAYSFEYVMTTR